MTLRVLHTVASLDSVHGGPSRSVPALARALRQLGVTADVHAWDEGDRIDVARYDVIHDHGIWLPANHRSATIARRRLIPRVVSVRGMLEPWALRRRKWKKRLAWSAYQRRDLQAAAVVHVTSNAEGESVRHLGLRMPLAFIPNGVEAPGSVPERIANGRRCALFLSRLHPIKGVPLLVEAWARVRPDSWKLTVAGPDANGHRAQIEQLTASLNLNGSVEFVGPVDDEQKWQLYGSADVFVLPTLSENFGLVVAEALAAGVPVITTKGAPWAVLETHHCGWWVDAAPDALAAALREAVNMSDDERRAMGRRGRRYVEEHLSWRRAAAQMRDIYEHIVLGGPAPTCMSAHEPPFWMPDHLPPASIRQGVAQIDRVSV